MVKTICSIQHTQNTRKSGDKDGKAFYKLMNNAIYSKTMENLRNRIDVKFVNNKKDFLKYTLKPSYLLHKVFDNGLAAIHKRKVRLMLNKQTCAGMCILELSKVLMYKFH